MRKTGYRKLLCGMTAVMTFMVTGVSAGASAGVSSVLPNAGIDYALSSEQTSLSELQESSEKSSAGSVMKAGVASALASEKKILETTKLDQSILRDVEKETGADVGEKGEDGTWEYTEEDRFRSLVIAQVDDYVNVRSIPSTDGEIVGKLYNKSVGTYLGEVDGWYEIKSGSVTGYVKAEYCVVGDAAVELAPKIGTRIATVSTTTLKVREEADISSSVLGLVPEGDELVVEEELDGWVKVDIEEGYGYVSLDYVTLSTEFVKAESKAEEEARLAKERAAREAALAAQRKNTSRSTKSGGGKTYNSAESYTTKSSSIGQAVAQYACQFVGNPYVYGGTSLTGGADCSGFVMSVYKNFGVSLPHSSAADRKVGAAVDGLANAQPGDIVCYSGHVAIYIGGGQIVHASTSKTGIIISNASYRNVLAVRRIF